MQKFIMQPRKESQAMYMPHGISIPRGALLGTWNKKIDWYCVNLNRDDNGNLEVWVYNYKKGRYYRQLRNDAMTDYILDTAHGMGIYVLDCKCPPKKSKWQRAREKAERIREREDREAVLSCFHNNPNQAKLDSKRTTGLKSANNRYAARGNSKLIIYRSEYERI